MLMVHQRDLVITPIILGVLPMVTTILGVPLVVTIILGVLLGVTMALVEMWRVDFLQILNNVTTHMELKKLFVMQRYDYEKIVSI